MLLKVDGASQPSLRPWTSLVFLCEFERFTKPYFLESGRPRLT